MKTQPNKWRKRKKKSNIFAVQSFNLIHEGCVIEQQAIALVHLTDDTHPAVVYQHHQRT